MAARVTIFKVPTQPADPTEPGAKEELDAFKVAKNERVYKEQQAEFAIYMKTEKALRALTLNAVDNK